MIPPIHKMKAICTPQNLYLSKFQLHLSFPGFYPASCPILRFNTYITVNKIIHMGPYHHRSYLCFCLLLSAAFVYTQPVAYGIVFNVPLTDSTGKTNYEVLSMRSDGSEIQNLTNHPAIDWAYRASNRTLYLVSDRDTCYRCYFLYARDPEDLKLKRVSNLQLEDSWMDFSPDGQDIIVSGRQGNKIRYQLFVIHIPTGAYEQITTDSVAMYSDPAWSPDGKEIVFSYTPNRRDRSTPEELYLMNRNGSNLRRLTYYPLDNVSRNSPGYKAGCAHWHPTENFISYMSMQDGRHSLFGITPDGQKQWKLTSHTFSEGWHDWSPDGQWLVFDKTEGDDSPFQILLMHWKSGEVLPLTRDDQNHMAPHFIRLR